ncbi:MAG: CpsD/CapB family tyrosine-protein kinase, partial [Acidimicrobiia bacterium]
MSNETTPSSTPRLRRRIFNAPTMLSFVAAVAVFILVSTIVSTNLGVAVAIGAGALAGGLIWWSLSSVARHRQLATVLTNLPDVGPIPTHEALAPAIGDGDAATAYRLAAQGLEERTTGQILLFTSPVPGWGTTTVALNTAIAASRLGRRVVFIDADLTCHGASRFLSTGPEPGLSSLADGTATLPQVARLLTVSTDVRLPVIPPGGPMDDEALLAGPEMGAAIDTMAATADLIIIDAPPVGWSDTTPHLAAHADGSVLVVSPKADPATTVATGERLADIGAPVLAYITNRSERVMTPLGSVWKSLIIRTVAMAVLLAAAFTLFTSGQLWAAWAGIDREEFSLADANVALDATTTTVDPGALPAVDGAHTTAPDPAPDTESPEMFETFLVIGG